MENFPGSYLARYFDHAATTPLDPRVLERMVPFLREYFGNPNSLHRWGAQAHEAVDRARSQVAELIGAEDPSQIYFTSGATEANNWVVRGFEGGLYSPFEHSSLLEAAQAQGWRIWPNQFVKLNPPATSPSLASVMAVNNEVGSRWDVRHVKPQGARLHVDATQIVGKLPFTVDGLDFASMSAHKLYGPKGVGALYCASAPPDPLLKGGEQEFGARAGTLNVPGIVGFGAAAELAREERIEDEAHATFLKQLVKEELRRVSDWIELGGSETSPFILGMSFLGVEGETLVIEADQRGYAISSGAACSSRSTEPSHVLLAMGYDEEVVRGAIRISFGKSNNAESTLGLVGTLAHSVQLLRTMTGDVQKSAQRSTPC